MDVKSIRENYAIKIPSKFAKQFWMSENLNSSLIKVKSYLNHEVFLQLNAGW